ncbi:cystathionine gamma-lyase, putative [Babesia ovata]|uniref:Cystathionine gamma-lyase, putative n=1 Tax=Babesia ovata TaxID=189622 RepID=A0A2H6KDK8_9APIC|nr:cystathionine gamma-lyase, putative [Babesia ovata]GBE61075.1 cystathionine gamma-lyase, putative [Babesia ovata]
MTDGPHAAALSQARRRLNELLDGLVDVDDSTGLVTHCRDLVASLDDIIGYLSSGSPEDEEPFEKAYVSAAGDDENAELEDVLSELHREAHEAIVFLENVDLTAGGTISFLREDDPGRIRLLASQRSLRDSLSEKQSSLVTTIEDNESQLKQLDRDIATASAEAEQLGEATGNGDIRANKTPYSPEVEINNDLSLEKAITRSTTASLLIAALDASPLKVIEEGADYIVYEYTLEGSRRTLRVQDVGSNGLSFILDPTDAKAHAYLMEHLQGCKSRIQIAAVLQEALSLP